MNNNFETFEGLDVKTEFHGRMGKKFEKVLEIKNKLQAQNELSKDQFEIMNADDLMQRLYLK